MTIGTRKGFLIDMDGVIYHGNVLLPGVKKFIDWLEENKKNYLFLHLTRDWSKHWTFLRGWLTLLFICLHRW